MIKQAQELAQLFFFLSFFLSLLSFFLSLPLSLILSFSLSFFLFFFSHGYISFTFPGKPVFTLSPFCFYFSHLLQPSPCSTSGLISHPGEGKSGQCRWPPAPPPGSGTCREGSCVAPRHPGLSHPWVTHRPASDSRALHRARGIWRSPLRLVSPCAPAGQF